MSLASNWLDAEDKGTREDRIKRLEWLAANYPQSQNGFLINGGWVSIQLLEEVKYCFAYGQFLATVTLGVAFIERVLAAQFYGAGRDELERAGGLDLLKEALKVNWFSMEEYDQFDRVRRLRNPIVHFRRPLAKDTLEHRAGQRDIDPSDIAEADAIQILKSVFRMLQRSMVGTLG